jgi:hypothetical protein
MIMGIFSHGFMFAYYCSGGTYYVSLLGNDSNSGTETQPWKTIQKAADTLSAGDTALVRNGIYSPVTVNVSGSKVKGNITFQNYPGEKPIVDATGVEPPEDDTGLFLLIDRSYINISGFELRNYTTANRKATPTGIYMGGACRHIEIRNCNIHDIANTGGKRNHAGNAFGLAVYGTSTTPASQIVIDGNDIHNLRTGSSESLSINGNVVECTVSHNKVHDNNNIGIDFIGYEGTCPDPAQDRARDSTCTDNEVWNISSQNNQAYKDGDYSADGLYCDGSDYIILSHNIVHDCDIGAELSCEHPGKLTTNIALENNSFYHNRTGGVFLGGYAADGTGGTDRCGIYWNTFYEDDTMTQGDGEAQLRWRTSHCTFRGNIFYGRPDNPLITVPVTAADNVANRWDDNVYYTSAGADAAQWIWNNTTLTGFAAWQKASGQDAHSLFADPQLIRTGPTPDLDLQSGSPAIPLRAKAAPKTL